MTAQPTLTQLKQLARENNLKGFSKLKKAELLVFLENNGLELNVPKKYTVSDLKQLARQNNLKGFSKLKKAELFEFLREAGVPLEQSTAPVEVDEYKKISVEQLKQVARQNNLKGFSKLKKHGLITLLENNGFMIDSVPSMEEVKALKELAQEDKAWLEPLSK